MPSVDDFMIDFSKEIESGGGGGARYKPGTYRAKIIAAKPVVSAEKKTPGLEIILQFTEGKLKGKKIKDTLWATPKAFRRFRSLLEAVGVKVPKTVKLLPIAKAVKGKELYIEIDDEPGRDGYKTRSRVQFDGFISEEDYEPEDEADDDDDDDDDDLEADDDDDLEDDDEEDAPPPKAKRKKKPAPVEDDDDDDEDDEPAPAPKKRKAKAKAKPVADDDEEELDDLDLEDL